MDLLEDLTGGRQRLDKDRRFVGDPVGNPVEVAHRQAQSLGKSPVPTLDAEDRPLWTVGRPASQTGGAGAAGS